MHGGNLRRRTCSKVTFPIIEVVIPQASSAPERTRKARLLRARRKQVTLQRPCSKLPIMNMFVPRIRIFNAQIRIFNGRFPVVKLQ